jgi:hypothetical protein
LNFIYPLKLWIREEGAVKFKKFSNINVRLQSIKIIDSLSMLFFSFQDFVGAFEPCEEVIC